MTMLTEPPTEAAVASQDGRTGRSQRWVFFGPDALPEDPTARDHERRGRRWLVVSYVLCPCHIPITLAVLGAAFGGSALGAALTGNALRVGIVLTALYALVLWRGFRQIRIAKRLEADGQMLNCTPAGCEIVPRTPEDATSIGPAP